MAIDPEKEYLEYKETVMKRDFPYEYWLLSRDYLENAKNRVDYDSSEDPYKVTYPLAKRAIDYAGLVFPMTASKAQPLVNQETPEHKIKIDVKPKKVIDTETELIQVGYVFVRRPKKK